MNLKPKQGVVAFMQKVGIVAGATIAVATVMSFVWRKIEAPVYARAMEIDRSHTAREEKIDERHTVVEERLVALIEAHSRQDSMLIQLIRARGRSRLGE